MQTRAVSVAHIVAAIASLVVFSEGGVKNLLGFGSLVSLTQLEGEARYVAFSKHIFVENLTEDLECSTHRNNLSSFIIYLSGENLIPLRVFPPENHLVVNRSYRVYPSIRLIADGRKFVRPVEGSNGERHSFYNARGVSRIGSLPFQLKHFLRCHIYNTGLKVCNGYEGPAFNILGIRRLGGGIRGGLEGGELIAANLHELSSRFGLLSGVGGQLGSFGSLEPLRGVQVGLQVNDALGLSSGIRSTAPGVDYLLSNRAPLQNASHQLTDTDEHEHASHDGKVARPIRYSLGVIGLGGLFGGLCASIAATFAAFSAQFQWRRLLGWLAIAIVLTMAGGLAVGFAVA